MKAKQPILSHQARCSTIRDPFGLAMVIRDIDTHGRFRHEGFVDLEREPRRPWQRAKTKFKSVHKRKRS